MFVNLVFDRDEIWLCGEPICLKTLSNHCSKMFVDLVYDTDEIWLCGKPICLKTLSNHCSKLFVNLVLDTDEIWLCGEPICVRTLSNHCSKMFVNLVYDTDEIWLCGEPICVNTLSNHWRGPLRCISIQHGVLVTSCRWYSAPQPFTKLMRIEHIFVSSYTASNPQLTDCDRSAANSWLLKIFRLQPGGILQTVVGWKPCR